MPDPKTNIPEEDIVPVSEQDVDPIEISKPAEAYEFDLPDKSPGHAKDLIWDAVPSGPGDTLALGAARKMMKLKQNNSPSKNLLADRILRTKADDLGQISRIYGLKPDTDFPVDVDPALERYQNAQQLEPTQLKDLNERLDEFNKQLQDTYYIDQSQMKEGIILPVPDGWNNPYLQQIKRNEPAWSGNYIQLRKSDVSGNLIWIGYNKPSAMEGELEPVTVAATNFAAKGRGLMVEENGQRGFLPGVMEEMDSHTGMKVRKAIPEIEKFWEANPQETPASRILKGEEKTGNYRLTMLMSGHPEIYKEFNRISADAITENMSTGEGSMRLVGEAIANAYGLNKSVSDVQKSYTQFQVESAIENYNKFNEFSDLYSKQQNKLASKIDFLAHDYLRAAGKGDILDQLDELRVQMWRDPKSITNADKNTFYSLNRAVAMASNEIPELKPYVQQFDENAENFKATYSKALPEIALLSTPDGKKAIDLYQRQAVGSNMLNRLIDYFPAIKQQEKDAQARDEQPDRFSFMKSFIRGVNHGFQEMNNSRQTVASWLGLLSKEDIVSERESAYGRNEDFSKIMATPNRAPVDAEGKTSYWNQIANFLDGTAEFTGSMTPYLMAGAAAPVADGMGILSRVVTTLPENSMFMVSGYNDYYRQAREAGLDDQQAKIRGLLGGAALSLTQGIIPKSQLVQRAPITRELDDLVKAAAVPESSAIFNFLSKFANKEVLDNTVQGGLATISNELAQQIIDMPFGKDIVQPMSPTQLFEQTLMFGLQASLTNGMLKPGVEKEARNALVYSAQENPLQTMRAISDAIAMSGADGSYNRESLLKLRSEVAQAIKMEYPSNYTPEQKVATFDLIKNREELEVEKGKSDRSLHDSFDQKIKSEEEKIKKISDSPEEAIKYLDDRQKPLHEVMEKQGYFDEPKVNEPVGESTVVEAKPQEAAKEVSEIDTKLSEIEKQKELAPEEEKPFHDQRIEIVKKFGMDTEDLIKKMKEEGRLKVDCPPGTKKKKVL